VTYTAVEIDSYERAAKMATKWGTPLVALPGCRLKDVALSGHRIALAQIESQDHQLDGAHENQTTCAHLK